MTQTTMMLPPGDYLIIDPCYILDGTRLNALLDLAYAEGSSGVFTDPQTGALFGYSHTATGDGVYDDQDGHAYGVDSGILACLPLVMVDAVALATRPLYDRSAGQVCCGRMVTFTTPSVCSPCDEEGVIRFGHIAIETGPTWETLRARWDEDEDC